MPEPIVPSVDLVKSYLGKWDTLEKYTLQEASLALLFHELCPRNDEIAPVLLKVSALNDFYSTYILDTHAVAKHILALSINSRIINGDASLVNDMALVTIGGKPRNFYSFASKYCNHHNADAFPIYDSYVHKMLMFFRRVDAFEHFEEADLKIYTRFVEVIIAFRKYYDLEQFTLRQIDIYLWLAGKDAFPRKRKSPKRKSE